MDINLKCMLDTRIKLCKFISFIRTLYRWYFFIAQEGVSKLTYILFLYKTGFRCKLNTTYNERNLIKILITCNATTNTVTALLFMEQYFHEFHENFSIL